MTDEARRPPSKRKRLKVAVLYNVDFEDSSPEGDPGWAARADVQSVAVAVAQALEATGTEVERIAVYGDRVKEVLRSAGVPTPDACLLRRADDPCDLAFPVIAKPVREDGSVGI